MSHSLLKPQLTLRERIEEIISALVPFDGIEKDHKEEVLAWIQSGAPLFRVEKPAIPPKHLCSYFVLFDEKAMKVLLVDHKKSGLWLPTGGHVDVDELPHQGAARECEEELGIQGDFWRDELLFLTSTLTVGLTSGHIDVSLWYVMRGREGDSYIFDPEEFYSIKWFSLEEIPYEKSDRHMGRFIQKLKTYLKE
jgi:8-oxo-dGTP pyrophosphatase MutT (NUDIX family)